MNDNVDIKKQLEVKNKEIYHNKLKLDLDNNLEVLVLTINNLLEKLQQEATTKILEIKESFLDQSAIEKKIKFFMETYQTELTMLLSGKKSSLETIIFKIENIAPIKNNLEELNVIIKNKLNEKQELIQDLNHQLKQYFDTDFKLKRLTSYLNDIFWLNLNTKILETIKSRDIILFNTFQESYHKYLELNKNIVGT